MCETYINQSGLTLSEVASRAFQVKYFNDSCCQLQEEEEEEEDTVFV